MNDVDSRTCGSASGAALHTRRRVDGPRPLLVFFHGGGFVVGGLDTHGGLCGCICHDAGVHVLSVDYRLAPEHPAPAAVDDCYAAYRWAVEHAAEFGADPARVAVGGDSAGGNLAAVVAQLRATTACPACPAAAALSRHQLRERHQVHDAVRRRVLPRRRRTWTGSGTTTIGGLDVDPVIRGSRRCLPRICPGCLRRWSDRGFDPLRDEGNQYAEALAAAGVSVDPRQFGSVVHAFANFFPLGGAGATATPRRSFRLFGHT